MLAIGEGFQQLRHKDHFPKMLAFFQEFLRPGCVSKGQHVGNNRAQQARANML